MAPVPAYREWSIGVPGATLWRSTAVDDATVLVLPDGCLDLLLIDDRLVVAGPDTRAREVAPARPVLGLRLAGGRGPQLLGLPAHELTDTMVDLSDLWGAPGARALRDRLRGGPPAWARWADQVGEVADPLAAGVLADAAAGHGVDAIARRGGVTSRTLLRRSRAAFGYGPQHLIRVLRLQRALALARAGTPWADVAARAGYADQPHLAREARALGGRAPTVLVGHRAANRSTGSPSGSSTVA